MQTDPQGASAPGSRDAALGKALRSKLDARLSALRASLESLAHELREDPRCAGVGHALEEVSRTGRTVRDLADYAEAPVPMPIACTVEEVAYSARHRLASADRDRVTVAHFDRRVRILIDGPVLSRVAERLIQNAVEATRGEVLVTTRCSEQTVSLSVLNAGVAPAADSAWAERPFQSSKPDHLGLGLSLAKRDVEILGGTLLFARTPQGETVTTVQVPHTGVQRPSAEI